MGRAQGGLVREIGIVTLAAVALLAVRWIAASTLSIDLIVPLALVAYAVLERVIGGTGPALRHAARLPLFLAGCALAWAPWLLREALSAPVAALLGIAILAAWAPWALRREPSGLLTHPLFLCILALKLLLAATLASDHLFRGVLPLVQHFVQTGTNPYDAFVGTGVLEHAHPLSPLVLLILSCPFAILGAMHLPVPLQLLILKLPLLAADIWILLLLARLVPGKSRELLLIYWASPIVIFVTYAQGQLDILPILFLVLSLLLILRGRTWPGLLVLALGVVAKANILAALPFILLYLWRHRMPLWKLACSGVLVCALPLLAVLPLRDSPGFSEMLRLTGEQASHLVLGATLTIETIALYLVPLLIMLFALRLSYYKLMGQDTLLMAQAVAFIILVIFVPPISGWFLWSFPFIAYFFLKHEEISSRHLWLYTVAFLFYFAIAQPGAQLLQLLQPLFPSLHDAQVFGALLGAASHQLLANLSFTFLFATMVINAVWIYSHGIISGSERTRRVLIGIAGDSGSGKSTLTKHLAATLGEENCMMLEGDDLHKWERRDPSWERITHLDPHANRLHDDLRIAQGIGERTVLRRSYDHGTGKFTSRKAVHHGRFVILSGLHTLYLNGLRERLDVRIFLENDPRLQLHWKLRRDVGERGHTRANVLKQVRSRAKDRARHIDPQRAFADVTIGYWPVRPMSDADVRGRARSPDLSLSLRLSNSIEIEPVAAALRSVPTLTVTAKYNKDLQTQQLRILGSASAAQIESIAHDIMPGLSAFLEEHRPRFEDGLAGVEQLLLLWIVRERAGRDAHG